MARDDEMQMDAEVEGTGLDGERLEGERPGVEDRRNGVTAAQTQGRAGWIWWAVLGALGLAVAVVRWRLLDAPLERDEGEYAVFGQFLLDGVPPYAQAVNMKLPGIYATYAGILAVFGETARGIHQGLLVANLLSGVLAALLARRLFRSDAAGWTAAAALWAYTLGPRLQGPWANAEAFLLPWVLLAGLLLESALRSPRRLVALVPCGLALGVAVLVKQHGVFFCLTAGAILLGWHIVARSRSGGPRAAAFEAGTLTAATLVPYLFTALVLWASGVFERFWFWTWEYARAYTGQVTTAEGLERLRLLGSGTLQATWPLVALAALGILGLVVRPGRRALGGALLLLALFSFTAVSVGFLYRPHYFQLLAPAVALGCAAWVAAARSLRPRIGLGAVAALAVLYVPFEERALLFEGTPEELTASVYPGNGFEGMPEVAEYIAELVPEGERFAVIGSEPELYFYADRRPATSYVYTYALMELQPFAVEMHGEMASEIEAHEPDVLVVVYTPTSWLQRAESETYIQSWAEQYLRNRFTRTGVLVQGPRGLHLFEGEQARTLQVPDRRAVYLEIYRRTGS